MATSPINNKVRSGSNKSIFPSALALMSSSVTINQGDLVALDTSGHVLKAVTADGDDQQFLGVSPVSVVNGKLVSPYQGTAVDAAEAFSDVPGPEYDNCYSLGLHLGDAFNPGDLVYLSVADDAQTVTSSSNTGARHAIGIFQGAAVGSAAAGQKGIIKIGARYPGSVLTF